MGVTVFSSGVSNSVCCTTKGFFAGWCSVSGSVWIWWIDKHSVLFCRWSKWERRYLDHFWNWHMDISSNPTWEYEKGALHGIQSQTLSSLWKRPPCQMEKFNYFCVYRLSASGLGRTKDKESALLLSLSYLTYSRYFENLFVKLKKEWNHSLPTAITLFSVIHRAIHK